MPDPESIEDIVMTYENLREQMTKNTSKIIYEWFNNDMDASILKITDKEKRDRARTTKSKLKKLNYKLLYFAPTRQNMKRPRNIQDIPEWKEMLQILSKNTYKEAIMKLVQNNLYDGLKPISMSKLQTDMNKYFKDKKIGNHDFIAEMD